MNYTAEAVKTINQKVNELLLKYEESKDTTVDPSVDIMKIAKTCGIKKVMFVSADQLDGKHAVVKNGVVKIDERDREGQRLFDLAHEVGHIVFNQITKTTYFTITPPGMEKMTNEPLFTVETEYKAARQGTKKKSELPPEEQIVEDFIDHFAANLLVPINRFQLWEDKSDKEIAQAFKVEEKCIKKRRQEVVYELNILTEEMSPCPIEAVTDPNVKLDIEAVLREVNG